MWIIQSKKYAGILAQLSGMNNVVNIIKGGIRVAVPSGVGYAELKVEELDEDIDKMFDIAPLIQMMGSKACSEVYFFMDTNVAVFKKPYLMKKNVQESTADEERTSIESIKDIPQKIRMCVATNPIGTYVDDEGTGYPVVTLLIDNVIFMDMARQLGAPRTILKIQFDKDAMTVTNGDGEPARYPKPKEDIYPEQPIGITLSMETQPLVFSSLFGEKSRIYIVHEKFLMVEASAGLFTFMCADATEEGGSSMGQFEAPKFE